MDRNLLLVICSQLINAVLVFGDAVVHPCKTPQYAKFGTEATIHCNFTEDYFGIYWYNSTDYINEYSMINIRNAGHVKTGLGFDSGEFDVHPNGSLIITEVNFGNAHNYTVVKLDLPTDPIIPYYVEVIVVAIPTPPHPVIAGCSSQRKCKLDVAHQVNLTCSLVGIFPAVGLEWITFEDDSSVTIIPQEQSITRSTDGLYDVVLTSTFYRNGNSKMDYPLKVECRVTVLEKIPSFHLSSSVNLSFTTDTNDHWQSTSSNNVEVTNDLPIAAVVVPVIVLVVVIITSVVFMIVRGRKSKEEIHSKSSDHQLTENKTQPILSFPKKGKSKEDAPLLEITAKSERFRQHLKATYKKDFGSLTVISTIKDKNGMTQPAKGTETVVQMSSEPNGVAGDEQVLTSASISKKSNQNTVFRESTSTNPASTGKRDVDKADKSGYTQHTILIEPTIEMLNMKPGSGAHGIWEDVELVSDVLNNSNISSKRFIIEGEFGHELSPICKLLARQWSTEDESELAKSFDILIVLKCNEIYCYQPIYAEIKRVLEVSELTEDDIQELLCDDHCRVAVVLDGFNMYAVSENTIEDDVTKLVRGKILKECTVVITTSTSCVPKNVKDFTRLRALGLRQEDQIMLIEREMFGRDAATEEQIKQLVRENVLLMDVLRIPFFFFFFLKRVYFLKNLPKFESVTSFFTWILSELSRQCPIQYKDYDGANAWKDETVDVLGKLAVEVLTVGLQGRLDKGWSKTNLLTRLNQNTYKFYKDVGIICEEMLPMRSSPSKKGENGSAHLEVRIRFTHPLFCEWYAARHLKTMVKEQGRGYTEDIVNILLTKGHWYCIRFFCGIEGEYARELCERIEQTPLQLLCMIESKKGNRDDVIKKSCPKRISLGQADSRLHQLATVQLLEVGWKKEAFNLELKNCFNSVKDASNALELKSGIQIPALTNIKHLDIIEKGRELTNEETAGILKYAVKSTKLKVVRFSDCILPPGLDEVKVDGAIQLKDIKVQWTPNKDFKYSLDWKTNTWKDPKGGVLDDYLYKKLLTEFRNTWL